MGVNRRESQSSGFDEVDFERTVDMLANVIMLLRKVRSIDTALKVIAIEQLESESKDYRMLMKMLRDTLLAALGENQWEAPRRARVT